MGNPPNFKKITTEDFPPDQQQNIGKLAFPINSFSEQVRNLFDGNVDFLNLNQELVTVKITVNGSGIPTTSNKVKSNLRTKAAGYVCIRAFNLTNSANYPTSTPFINFTQSGNIVTINQISGLVANEKYSLVLLSIGN